MRNAFINKLTELAAERKDIFLICGDLGFSVLEQFASLFPDRFLNIGIAEQNMMQVATGLAFEGYNVFTYSIGNFPTLRCCEQIRYDICYHRANVKIIAVGGGYAYGPQGASHHTTEDFAVMRVMPNMTVCAPADAAEAVAIANLMSTYSGPGYIRLNKSGEPSLHDQNQSLNLTPGSILLLRDGRETAVIAAGSIAWKALSDVQNKGLNWSVYSAPFIGSYSEADFLLLARKYHQIYTIEEHQLNGGFGSTVVEMFSDMYNANRLPLMPKIKRVAIPNKFLDVSGSQEYLRIISGLSDWLDH